MDGLKEGYEIAVSRLLSFGAYIMGFQAASSIPIVKVLFSVQTLGESIEWNGMRPNICGQPSLA